MGTPLLGDGSAVFPYRPLNNASLFPPDRRVDNAELSGNITACHGDILPMYKIMGAGQRILRFRRLCDYHHPSSDIVPADIPLDILYEDDTLLVVNKGIPPPLSYFCPGDIQDGSPIFLPSF